MKYLITGSRRESLKHFKILNISNGVYTVVCYTHMKILLVKKPAHENRVLECKRNVRVDVWYKNFTTFVREKISRAM